MKDIRKPSGSRWGQEVGPFLTMGIQLALSVVVLFFLGRFLDEKFDTAPWLMIVGLCVGVVGGMIKFFMTALELGRKADRGASSGGDQR